MESLTLCICTLVVALIITCCLWEYNHIKIKELKKKLDDTDEHSLEKKYRNLKGIIDVNAQRSASDFEKLAKMMNELVQCTDMLNVTVEYLMKQRKALWSEVCKLRRSKKK